MPLPPPAADPCFPPFPAEGNTLSAPWRTQHMLVPPPPPLPPTPPPSSSASDPLEPELCRQPIVTRLLTWCQVSTPVLRREWRASRWSVPSSLLPAGPAGPATFSKPALHPFRFPPASANAVSIANRRWALMIGATLLRSPRLQRFVKEAQLRWKFRFAVVSELTS